MSFEGRQKLSEPGYYYSYLHSAVQLLESYQGEEPFHLFLKNYFSRHKKFGSKDRRQIAGLCYGYFRLGKSFPELSLQQRILKGIALTNAVADSIWKDIVDEANLPAGEPENIFPWKDALSETIDVTAFEASFLVQPDLFLRIRPGFEKQVVHQLSEAGVKFEPDGCAMRLDNAVKVDTILGINREVIIQDLSSQQVGTLLDLVKSYIVHLPAGKQGRTSDIPSVWDCCAGSGGKSIMATDVLGKIQLTVSDIRSSILNNLRKRFAEAGIQNYRSFVADVATIKSTGPYDLIIADVPCTGSGTWARTPEQLYFFAEDKIATYAALQKRIIDNVMTAVKPGGYLLYVTCSVFKQENEEQVAYLLKNLFKPVQQGLIKGYLHKADTLFAALLQKQIQ